MTATATLRLEMTTTDLAAGLAGTLDDEDLLEFVGMLEKNVGRETFTMGLSWLAERRAQRLFPNHPEVRPSLFGLILREERIKRGMSQTKLGEASGMRGDRISCIERGLISLPRSATVERISKALGVDLAAILKQKGGGE